MSDSKKASLTDKKVILPFEVKVCATCSYWDGPKKVDDEMHLVIAAESCTGECLVRSHPMLGLSPVNHNADDGEDCAWENLANTPEEK